MNVLRWETDQLLACECGETYPLTLINGGEEPCPGCGHTDRSTWADEEVQP